MSRKHTARVAPEEAAFRPALPLCPLPGISEMRMSNTRQFEESLFSDDAVVLPHQPEIRAYFNRAGTVTILVEGDGMVAIPCHAILLLADRLLELAQQDTEFSDDDFSEPNE